MAYPSKKLPGKEIDIVGFLRQHGIQPTSQRAQITRLLLERCTHLSAEDVYRLVNAANRHVSKATVYNTLGLLTEKGVIREVIADPGRVFYDPNTKPHHHFYDVVTGELRDIDAEEVAVTKLPPLPAGTDLERVDVVVRLRHVR
jgi:Fur family iron response transcriptional regulator